MCFSLPLSPPSPSLPPSLKTNNKKRKNPRAGQPPGLEQLLIPPGVAIGRLTHGRVLTAHGPQTGIHRTRRRFRGKPS